MSILTDDDRFTELLEKPDCSMTDADWLELGQLERKLHDRDVDRQMRAAFRDLDRAGALVRVH